MVQLLCVQTVVQPPSWCLIWPGTSQHGASWGSDREIRAFPCTILSPQTLKLQLASGYFWEPEEDLGRGGMDGSHFL